MGFTQGHTPTKEDLELAVDHAHEAFQTCKNIINRTQFIK
jgi:hypothetical protein